MRTHSEADTTKRIVKFLDKIGITTYRNNVGLTKTNHGSWIKYGLCNGSSDRIGYKSVVITPEMVGKRVAIFTAIEIKRPKKKKQVGGVLSEEQIAFLDSVSSAGGLACVADIEDDIIEMLKAYGLESPVLI